MGANGAHLARRRSKFGVIGKNVLSTLRSFAQSERKRSDFG